VNRLACTGDGLSSPLGSGQGLVRVLVDGKYLSKVVKGCLREALVKGLCMMQVCNGSNDSGHKL